MVLSGASDYTLTREDVGSRVVFTYIPVNFEGLLSVYRSITDGLMFKRKWCFFLISVSITGKEGESASVFSDMIRQGNV